MRAIGVLAGAATSATPTGRGPLAVVAVVAASLVLAIWLGRFAERTAMVLAVRRTVRAPARDWLRGWWRTAVLQRRVRWPRDAFDLSTVVVAPPLPDGRPGWTAMVPGPPLEQQGIDRFGARQDATVPLEPGTTMHVVSFGRVGAAYPDGSPDVMAPLEDAEGRARAFRSRSRQGMTPLGPVALVETPLGPGWRVTTVFASGAVLTDTHLDRDGWAVAIGVMSASGHERALAALDAILAGWCWLPARSAAQAPPAPEW